MLPIRDQTVQPHSGILVDPFACKTSGCSALSSPTCLQPVSVLLYTCSMFHPVSRCGELLPEQYGCRNLLELCLTLPHICYVHALLQHQSAQQEHWVCAAVTGVYVAPRLATAPLRLPLLRRSPPRASSPPTSASTTSRSLGWLVRAPTLASQCSPLST